MKRKISSQYFFNYLVVFIISILAAFFALLLLQFANDVIAKTLTKNTYTAESLMQDDYKQIVTEPVVRNGGGVQIIDQDYKVVYTNGLDTIGKKQLTVAEFTDFLTQSRSKGIPYSYDITYNERTNFWLVVTFPTSIRIDFAIVYNKEGAAKDMQNVVGALIAILIFYILLLALSALIFSKFSSIRVTKPLRKLCDSTSKIQNGKYSERVNLNLNNEFGELEDNFNAMAEQIEREILLRKQSEENRKNLVLDISHDLKNPLASITGYADLCLKKRDIIREQQEQYLRIIYENSMRANKLMNGLFELSKMDSPGFLLKMDRIDVCEYLREWLGDSIPQLEEEGFPYECHIPDSEIFAMLDVVQMDRVLANLLNNMIEHNVRGTKLKVELQEKEQDVVILFEDNGVGMPSELSETIFLPFVRVDRVRGSQSGGTGLGLAIVAKIVELHGGTITLRTKEKEGCTFSIRLPKI
jgi:signal transduction histidine kinase